MEHLQGVDTDVHAFLYVDKEGALAQAAAVDAKRAKGEKLSPLAGVPLALKDVMVQLSSTRQVRIQSLAQKLQQFQRQPLLVIRVILQSVHEHLVDIHGAEYSLLDYNRAGIPLVEIVTKIVPGTGKYAPWIRPVAPPT